MIEEVRKRLAKYKKEEIKFNEPHFTEQIASREGNRQEVIDNLLNPKRLVYAYKDRRGKNEIYNLHFKISNTRTMRLPVIFDKDSRKGLYILTYIMRYRAWQNMIRK